MDISVCVYSTDKNEAENLQRYIAAVLFNADYRSRVMSCSTDSVLRSVTMKYPFVDILFLPATASGISFGEELRKVNRTTTIVFVSDDDRNVFRAFRSLPIAYLINNHDKKQLSEAILRAASWAMAGKSVFYHESRTQILQLKYRDIDYFESEYRIVHIHKSDGECETITAKLDEVEAMLPANIFCRCHQSYLVNIENIDRFNKSDKTVIFKSGAIVFSSKARYQTLIDALKGDAICETV
ncbi:MAG: LytTR family DNA-binding domain-containing protein [Oscillospiraceae bacterium]|nr:LytTR family DNA-binding domain-containing protein [Oscillospiraceae bacterium]